MQSHDLVPIAVTVVLLFLSSPAQGDGYADYLRRELEITRIEVRQGKPGARQTLEILTREALRVGLPSTERTRPPSSRRERERMYEPIVYEAAQTYGLSPPFIMAVIRAESDFMEEAQSPMGACGLMQLMPATAKSLGVKHIFDPRENVMGGSALLSNYLLKYNSVEKALIAYNASPGRVWKARHELPEETREYVPRVIRYYVYYRDRSSHDETM